MPRYIVLRRHESFGRLWHEVGSGDFASGKAAVEKLADLPGEYRAIKGVDFNALTFEVTARKLYVARRRTGGTEDDRLTTSGDDERQGP